MAASATWGQVASAGPLPFREAVRAGDLLLLSGQIGMDSATGSLVPGGTAAQARQAMTNIVATLGRNGLSVRDLVQCRVFLDDMNEWAAFNQVYTSFFPDGIYPARSASGADGLALDAKVEIECTAAFPASPVRYGSGVAGAPYSQAVANAGQLHIAGIVPFDSSRGRFADSAMEAQVDQVLANLDAVLRSAGVGRADIVSATVVLKDAKDKKVLDDAWSAYFAGQAYPARTLIAGADWGRDDLRIEISAIAALPGGHSR